MSKRIFYPLVLLLIPLIGIEISDEINWSAFDFMVMGGLLLFVGIGIDMVINKTRHGNKRTLFIGLVILLFLLIWAELAVGVFGSPLAGS